jgi:antirestriction protein ArdC
MLDYQLITDNIIQQMEVSGTRWPIPWPIAGNTNYIPFNVATKKPYPGINALILWDSATRNNYEHGIWGTHKQWEAMGYKVRRKGLNPEMAVFWHINKDLFVAKPLRLLNCIQVDGYKASERTVSPENARLAAAANYFAKIGADLRHGGDNVCFQPNDNYIQIPNSEQFNTDSEYYSTLSRIHIRWTGTAKRLKRDYRVRYGPNAYVFEGLIEQIGGAFLAAQLGIELTPMPEHEKYLPMWLKMMRDDNQAIFKAARDAQNAFDWLNMKAQATR